ncbi:hypothetical protein [Sphingosinicella sp.]|uniref:hypothetical protein n=1 Tax=Sphingosinicella sp. TaxID=1917971 RepID=UPI0040383017
MDLFNFILVMVSLILAIGVTHLIQRVAEIIRIRDTVPLDWLQLTWALSLFLLAALYWWSLWDMRNADWTFPKYFLVLLSPTLLNFAVSLLVATDRASDTATAPFNLARIRLPFMLIMAASMVAVSWDAWLVGTEPAWTAYRPIQVFVIGLYFAGAALPGLTAQRVIAGLVLLTYVIGGFVYRLLPGAFAS